MPTNQNHGTDRRERLGAAPGVCAFLDLRVHGVPVQVAAMPKASRGSIARVYLPAGETTGWTPRLADLKRKSEVRRRYLLRLLACSMLDAGGG